MNLLITGAWSGAKTFIDEIKNNGHDVVFMQQEKESLPCTYDWVEGVICNGLFLHHLAEKFVNLRYVQLTSAGFDRVPMDYFEERGIKVYNARGVYSIPMAEYAIASVLQFSKRCMEFYNNQKVHKWEKIRTITELTDKTVCIIGCGSVGTECAKRFEAFGCKVIGVDLVASRKQYFAEMFDVSELDNCLKVTDIVVLTLPLTEKTRHLIDERKLSFLKDGSILVNIARGAIIDTDALIEVLDKGRIYAALDVHEEEPLSERSPLWDMPNVIITPHNSFVGDLNENRLYELVIKNLQNA